jgi:hypothetical protein
MARFRITTEQLMLLVLALRSRCSRARIRRRARDPRLHTHGLQLDSAVTFYEQALGFSKVGERDISDRNFDYLTGVFGTRVRQPRCNSATSRSSSNSSSRRRPGDSGGQPLQRSVVPALRR